MKSITHTTLEGDSDSLGNIEMDESECFSPTKRGSLPENNLGVFNVLENFNLTCFIRKYNGLIPPPGTSKVELKMDIKDLQLNLSPKMYNHLVNIHRIFKVSTQEEDVEANIEMKERHIAEAKLIC
jgi:hypothetical protein